MSGKKKGGLEPESIALWEADEVKPESDEKLGTKALKKAEDKNWIPEQARNDNDGCRNNSVEGDYGKMAVLKLKDETDVVRFEKTNFGVVVVYHTRDVWFGATMHSAYFMSEIIQEMVGLRTQVKWMHDNYYNMDRPMINYHMGQVNKIRDTVKTLGHRVIRDDGEFFVFVLPEVVEKSEIVEWLNSEKMRREKLKKYFLNNDYGLFKLCRELASEILMMKVKGVMDGKDAMMGMLTRYAMEIHELASVWESAEGKEKLVAKKEIERRIERCSFVLATLADRRAVDDGRLIRIGTGFAGMRNVLKGGDREEKGGE